MIAGKKITVAVPAYNEERLLARTLESIPALVDRVIVVDDASSDDTPQILEGNQDPRLDVIRHDKNEGVGAAIATAYKRFLETETDICVVMGGDAQMDPDDLVHLVAPVRDGRADYAKGNRLHGRDVRHVMPRQRFLGNILFTLMTKWASGYWHVVDSQCGYTAVTREMIRNVDLDGIYKRYGFPNDLLIRLNVARARVCDVPVRAIYGQEVSGIRPLATIPRIAFLLVRGFWWRMWNRYVLRDFHPLVLLYGLGFFVSTVGLAGGLWILVLRWGFSSVPTPATTMLVVLCVIIGFLSLMFAMMFDMIHNSELRVRK